MDKFLVCKDSKIYLFSTSKETNFLIGELFWNLDIYQSKWNTKSHKYVKKRNQGLA